MLTSDQESNHQPGDWVIIRRSWQHTIYQVVRVGKDALIEAKPLGQDRVALLGKDAYRRATAAEIAKHVTKRIHQNLDRRSECPWCLGAGDRGHGPCHSCCGTGRIMFGEVPNAT